MSGRASLARFKILIRMLETTKQCHSTILD
jgi:hypothetical protein